MAKSAAHSLSPEEASHVRHLWDHPDDTDAWRVYGDWLQQQGDARGELLALDMVDVDPYGPARAQREGHIATLLDSLASNRSVRVFWRRGHIRLVSVPDAKTLRLVLALPAALFLEEARLTVGGSKKHKKTLRPFLKLLEATRVTRLDLRECGFDSSAGSLVAACNRPLTYLNMNRNRLGTDGAVALAGAQQLAGVRELGLRENRIGDKGVAAVASATHLRSLSSLDLDYNELGAHGAEAIASAEHLGSLTSLNLSLNAIGDVGVQALAGAPHFSSLRHLGLARNHLSVAGCRPSPTHRPCPVSRSWISNTTRSAMKERARWPTLRNSSHWKS